MTDKVFDIRRVPWSVLDALVVFITPWVLLPIGAIIALQFIAPDVSWVNHYLDALGSGSVKAAFSLVILEAVGSFFLIRYYLRKYHAGWQSVGWRRFNVLKTAFWVVVVPIAFLLLVSLALFLAQHYIPGFNAEQPQTNEFIQNTAPNLQIYSVLAIIIFPPILEETVFRGFLFPALSKRYGLVFGAIVSSAFFGLAHLQGNVTVYTFVLGLLLCFLYRRTGSIIPGMVLHMANNYLAFTALTQK